MLTIVEFRKQTVTFYDSLFANTRDYTTFTKKIEKVLKRKNII